MKKNLFIAIYLLATTAIAGYRFSAITNNTEITSVLEPDGSDIITQTVLDNALLDKTDLTVIADEFETNKTYQIGTCVIYNGVLNICTNTHSSAAWNANNFRELSVYDLIQKSSADVYDLVNIDLNGYLPVTRNNLTYSTEGSSLGLVEEITVDDTQTRKEGILANGYVGVSEHQTNFDTGDESAAGMYITISGLRKEDDEGTKNYTMPDAAGKLALQSEIVSAKNQIYSSLAPAFTTNTTYDVNTICSYEGRVYQCTNAITAATSTEWDASNWIEKPVSDLYLPITGGTVTGSLAVTGANGISSVYMADGQIAYMSALTPGGLLSYTMNESPKQFTFPSSAGVLATTNDIQTAVSNKQDSLTFDSVPKQGSSNVLTSGTIYSTGYDTACGLDKAEGYYIQLWKEPNEPNQKASRIETINFKPSAFGMPNNSFIHSFTIRTSDTVSTLPTVPVFAKIIDPDDTSKAKAVSQPVCMFSGNTDYTFVFDRPYYFTDATKTYRLVFYSGAADGAEIKLIAVRLYISGESPDLHITYVDANSGQRVTMTTWRPIMSAKWSEKTMAQALDTSTLAPIASPAFTGTPTAPDITQSSSDGQIVNKKYVTEQIDTDSPLVARSFTTTGTTTDNYNNTNLYFRSRYFGMTDGDRFKTVIVRTREDGSAFSTIYARLRRFSDNAVLAISNAQSWPSTDNTDVPFTFPVSVVIPSKDDYYYFDFVTENSTTATATQIGLRIYNYSPSTNLDCYFGSSTIVPILTAQFYSFASDLQTTGNLVTSISASSTDTQYPSAKCVYEAVEGVNPSNKLNSTSVAPAFSTNATYSVGKHCTYNGDLYECVVAKSTASATTPDQDIYDESTAPTNHWKVTDMTSPDATLDITPDGALRVVAADGITILWCQGYDLKTTSSATLANEAVNKYDFATNATASVSLTLPTPPTGKVGDFILDVTNAALDTTNFTQSAFDSEVTYAVGDEVIYNSKIWRCVIAVETAGAWTGTTNWEEAWPYFSISGLGSTVEMVVAEGESLTDILSFAPGTKCELYFTLTAFAVDSHPTWKVVRQNVEVVE